MQISTVPDGLRHLRNYAKKRIILKTHEKEMRQILNETFKLVQQMPEEDVKRTGLKKSDLTECSEILR